MRTAENTLLQIQARALATIATPAIATAAPVLVTSVGVTTKKAVNRQMIAEGVVRVDSTQRKPQARAGLPATTKIAVNQQKTRT